MYETVNCPTCGRHIVKEIAEFKKFTSEHPGESALALFRRKYLQACCQAQIVCRVDTTISRFGKPPID